MVSLYVFSLILGGGFLAMAAFGDLFGGHGDVDVDGDLSGFDGHLELGAGGVDLDAGGLDLDAGGLDIDAGHLDVAAVHAELDADAGHLAGKIFSIRTLFYSLFGFGSVGTLLTFFWSGNPLLTAAFAVFSGVSSGAVINAAFGYVKRSESGMLQTEDSYVGISGRVIIPIRPEIPGRVGVERGGWRVKLRALPHSSGQGDPTTWKAVFVVEMEKGVARVAPVDEDMLLGS
jgi:membrane protein implicated in regulation of membrane protease activity